MTSGRLVLAAVLITGDAGRRIDPVFWYVVCVATASRRSSFGTGMHFPGDHVLY